MSKNLIKILHNDNKIVPFTSEDYIVHDSFNQKCIHIFNKNDDKTCTFEFKSVEEAKENFQLIISELPGDYLMIDLS